MAWIQFWFDQLQFGHLFWFFKKFNSWPDVNIVVKDNRHVDTWFLNKIVKLFWNLSHTGEEVFGWNVRENSEENLWRQCVKIWNLKLPYLVTIKFKHAITITIINKTGLQTVSRPVEQILGFYPKGLKIYPKGIIIKMFFEKKLIKHRTSNTECQTPTFWTIA